MTTYEMVRAKAEAAHRAAGELAVTSTVIKNKALLAMADALEAGAAIGFRSRFGLVLVALAAVLQIVIFVKYMVRGQVSRVLIAFKGE